MCIPISSHYDIGILAIALRYMNTLSMDIFCGIKHVGFQVQTFAFDLLHANLPLNYRVFRCFREKANYSQRPFTTQHNTSFAEAPRKRARMGLGTTRHRRPKGRAPAAQPHATCGRRTWRGHAGRPRSPRRRPRSATRPHSDWKRGTSGKAPKGAAGRALEAKRTRRMGARPGRVLARPHEPRRRKSPRPWGPRAGGPNRHATLTTGRRAKKQQTRPEGR